MIDFKYDFSLLYKMVEYVFLPILAIVVIMSFIIFIYSKAVKKKDIKRYNYIVDFWTTLFAILIMCSLYAVTIGFSMSLSNSIKRYNLVKGHELIYYLVVGIPIVPLLFLLLYVYRMIKLLVSKPKKEKKLVSEEEIVPEPGIIVEPEVKKEEQVSDSDEDILMAPIFISDEDVVESSGEESSEGKLDDSKEIEHEEENSMKEPPMESESEETNEEKDKNPNWEEDTVMVPAFTPDGSVVEDPIEENQEVDLGEIEKEDASEKELVNEDNSIEDQSENQETEEQNDMIQREEDTVMVPTFTPDGSVVEDPIEENQSENQETEEQNDMIQGEEDNMMDSSEEEIELLL